MGRVTVFGSNECGHCTRAKGALELRGLPFVFIDVGKKPSRRADMVALSQKVSVPQVFFNNELIGGADELEILLNKWDESSSSHSADIMEAQVTSKPDPTDPRLRLPDEDETDDSSDGTSEEAEPTEDLIKLPNGTLVSGMEVMLLLDGLLESKNRPYKAHMYNNCFVNHTAVQKIMDHFCCTREEAIDFGRELQNEHILHHVCEDHRFRPDGYYFFRLQCYHQPDVLNSFRVWTEPVNTKDVHSIMSRLRSMLGGIITSVTNQQGLINYIQAREHPDFPRFEDATCELQGIHMEELDEPNRLVFGLNLYNLMISYAFIKVGVGTTLLSRGAFFNQTKMKIGQDVLSFNDLENGVLRANTRHPYAKKVPFAKEDPRLRLSLRKLDCRIHFALNCGARSCPPVKTFHVETLQEELQLVSLSFCEMDEAVLIKEGSNELHLSSIFKWFQSDFCSSKDKLPETLANFLTGTKKETLLCMTKRAAASRRPISVKFQTYDWSTNATDFEPYKSRNTKANRVSAEALLRFKGQFGCISSTNAVAC